MPEVRVVEHEPANLRRFGYWSGHMVVVGSMIGAGILTTSGFILRDTGNPAALLGLWVVGGLLAICGALCIAELATAIPRSGGDYVFVREAFGRGAGFVAGWATFILGFAAPTAIVAHLALNYLLAPITATVVLPSWIVPLGASALIAVIGITHTLSHRHSSMLQLLATIVTGLVLVTIAVGGILFGRGDWNHLNAGDWPRENQWPTLAGGLIFVCYAYAGWNGAGYLAGEIRDPARLLPRCLLGGVISVVVLYALVNLAYVYALDPVQMTGRSKDDVERVAELATRALFGPTVAAVITVALGLCLVATVSAFLLTGSRIAFAMAQDGVFPRFAAHIHPERLTPVPATLTLAALAGGLVWAGSFLDLLNYAAIGLAALTGLTVASVFPIRYRREIEHPYRMPFFPIPPLAYLMLTGWTVGFVVADPESRGPALWSLATLLLGIPLSYLIPERRA